MRRARLKIINTDHAAELKKSQLLLFYFLDKAVKCTTALCIQHDTKRHDGLYSSLTPVRLIIMDVSMRNDLPASPSLYAPSDEPLIRLSD